MIIYHGSKNIIQTPMYGLGKMYNDYGRGFYCTENLELAKEWAVDFDRSGFVNMYELETDGLSILDLNQDQYTIMHWLAILLCNREFDIQSDFGDEAKQYIINNFSISYEQFDVIYGYRADDSYFTFAQDFLNNTISLSTLNEAIHLGKLGMQYALKSQKAFDRIKYVGNQMVAADEWYPLKEKRDSMARRQYAQLRQRPWKRGEIYILTILDEEIKSDDVRLRL